ncbi:oligoendopeptidase F [Haloferacaceae archaeon DSL9]
MSSVPERRDIEAEYKWDLESVYADDADWETAYEDVSERLDELRAYEGRATESAETLLELLELREGVMRDVAKVATYAGLRSSEDTRDQQYQALSARAQALSADASSAISYLEPELQRLGEDDIRAFLDSEPALEAYEHYFDDVLRMKPHTRSAEVEALLADLSEVTGAPGEVYSMLTNADMEFPTVDDPNGEPVEISQGNFTKLQKHTDREFRQTVHEAFYDEWADYRNSIGTSLKNAVKTDIKLAQARNYETAREAALDGSNIPVAVYDNLLDSVRDNLDHLHRHAELKREALGVDDLQMWDLYMSLTGDEGPEVSYEQAKEWVVDAVEPLGADYQDRMATGLEDRWVDVYENRGKRAGAYSSGTYDTQPFIMMNYQDDISSLFTLAHELGHSMHSLRANETQRWHDAGYDIFVAEVASTVNETLLTHHLLDTLEDEDLRMHVLDQYLERVRQTVYRQTMFADFEHRIHARAEAGDALTPDVFDELYGDLKGEFYAPATVDEQTRREWMRIPHFYYNFYVYQYATGLSAAIAIVERLFQKGDDAAADYRAMLDAGGSVYPLEALSIAGIDMTSAQPIDEALSVYGDYLDRAAKLL